MATDYLLAAALTLVVEVPVYALALRALLRVRVRSGAIAGVVVNGITHPLGFLAVMPALAPAIGSSAALAAVEVSACVIEAAILWTWLRRDPLLLAAISFVANSLSLSAGLALLH